MKTSPEHFEHDDCLCGTPSQPAENVPDQTLRICPTCGNEWFEDLTTPPQKGNPMDTIEIRVTRPDKYPLGSKPNDREGHYIRANSYEDAITKAKAKFPKEKLHIQLFKRYEDGFWQRIDDSEIQYTTIPACE